MSQATALDRLKEEARKIEESLSQLETQKKEVDVKYSSFLQEENRILEELRRCRDTYKYNQLEINFNIVSRRRREIEPQKTEIERKIRGYKEELAKLQARIEYLKPRDNVFITEEG